MGCRGICVVTASEPSANPDSDRVANSSISELLLILLEDASIFSGKAIDYETYAPFGIPQALWQVA